MSEPRETSARNASNYFATDHDREAFAGMFGDKLEAWFTPEFVEYVRTGFYPVPDMPTASELRTWPLPDQLDYFAQKLAALMARTPSYDTLVTVAVPATHLGRIVAELRKQETELERLRQHLLRVIAAYQEDAASEWESDNVDRVVRELRDELLEDTTDA